MRRRLAREIAVLSLYQLEMNDVTTAAAIDAVIDEAKNDNETNMELSDESKLVAYVFDMVEGVRMRKAMIDLCLADYLKGWTMDRLSRVDRQVLRLAVFEMVYREDVPPKVVINEAIELSKHFGDEESGKFVNGVLGKMLRELETVKQKLKDSTISAPAPAAPNPQNH